MTDQEIMTSIVDICRRYRVKEAILFGSRAKGTATERSDYDIAVSGVEQFEELEEAIDDIPTLHSFDVVNMDTCRNDLLLKEIQEYGRKILQEISEL